MNEPIVPTMDYWVVCPICGADPDPWDCGGFEPIPMGDGLLRWVGPSFCPNCGQAFDLSDFNDAEGAES